MLLQLINDEIYGVKSIGIDFVIHGCRINLMLFDSGSNYAINSLFVHFKHFMIMLIIRLLIIWTHFLFLNIPFNILPLQLINNFLLLQPLLMFLHFLWFDYVINELIKRTTTLRMTSFIMGYTFVFRT